MADQKKTAADDKPAKPAPVLGRAAESSDPAVHQLLSQRQTADINGDRDAIAEVDRQLRELGYE